jgi:hypothetical protein
MRITSKFGTPTRRDPDLDASDEREEQPAAERGETAQQRHRSASIGAACSRVGRSSWFANLRIMYSTLSAAEHAIEKTSTARPCTQLYDREAGAHLMRILNELAQSGSRLCLLCLLCSCRRSNSIGRMLTSCSKLRDRCFRCRIAAITLYWSDRIGASKPPRLVVTPDCDASRGT